MATNDDITLSDTADKADGESPAQPSITQSDSAVGPSRHVSQGLPTEGLWDITPSENGDGPQSPVLNPQRDDSGRFTPGHERLPGAGRAPGTKNKLDHHTKVMLKALVDHGLEDAQDVYDRIKAKQPRAALTILSRFAEYAAPKLARTELVGEDGGPVIIEKRIHDSSDKDKE